MINQFSEDTNKLINLMIHANQYRQAYEYRKAIDIYLNLIEQQGEIADISQLLASCYFQLGLYASDEDNFREAVNWIKRAIALSPMNSHFYDILGAIHSLGTLDYKAALQAYRTAIELDPYNVHALVSGAGLYGVPEEVISLEEAITWLERAVQIEPDNPNNHFNLGIRCHNAGQLRKAEQEWLRALSCPRPLDTTLSTAISKSLGIMKT